MAVEVLHRYGNSSINEKNKHCGLSEMKYLGLKINQSSYWFGVHGSIRKFFFENTMRCAESVNKFRT